jgi:hypothetical protein
MMMSVVHAVIGVFIGIVNDIWIWRLVTPAIWAAAFCGFRWILRRQVLPSPLERSEKKPGWHMSPQMRFYSFQFLRILSISLAFSVLSGFLNDLIQAP